MRLFFFLLFLPSLLCSMDAYEVIANLENFIEPLQDKFGNKKHECQGFPENKSTSDLHHCITSGVLRDNKTDKHMLFTGLDNGDIANYLVGKKIHTTQVNVKKVTSWRAHTAAVRGLAILPKYNTLVSTSEGAVQRAYLVDRSARSFVQSMKCGAINALTVIDTEYVATLGHTLNIYDARTVGALKQYELPALLESTDGVALICLASNKLVCVVNNSRLAGTPIICCGSPNLTDMPLIRSPITRLLALKDGNFITQHDAHGYYVWHHEGVILHSFGCLHQTREKANAAALVEVNDTTVATGLTDGTINLWDYKAGVVLKSLQRANPIRFLHMIDNLPESNRRCMIIGESDGSLKGELLDIEHVTAPEEKNPKQHHRQHDRPGGKCPGCIIN